MRGRLFSIKMVTGYVLSCLDSYEDAKEFSKHNVLSFSYKIKVRYKKSFQKINLLFIFQTLFSTAAQYSSKWRKVDRTLAFYFIFCFPDRVKH